jgi:DNA-binding response OmpR family regulator
LSRKLFSPSGKDLCLTSGEFELLAVLVNNANEVLSRDRLLDLTQRREAGPFDRTIDVQVGRLRRKLKDARKIPRSSRPCAAAATCSHRRSISTKGRQRAEGARL